MRFVLCILAFVAGILATLAITATPGSKEVRSLRPDGMREEYNVDREGLVHGEYREFHPNGQLAVRQVFRHGVAVETSQYFDSEGEPLE